jgi:hypothetical protein
LPENPPTPSLSRKIALEFLVVERYISAVY